MDDRESNGNGAGPGADESPAAWREYGRLLIDSPRPEDRARGFEYVLKAFKANDAEAFGLVGELVLQGRLRPPTGDAESYALDLLRRAANAGDVRSRATLNRHCAARYARFAEAEGFPKREGPLVDFEGRKIKIRKTGLLTPVDAVLSYADGVNCLSLRANLSFINTDALPAPERFKAAVVEGVGLWRGEYRVFNDQRLRVTVDVTTEDRLIDSVFVVPVSEDVADMAAGFASRLRSPEKAKKLTSILEEGRSFAALGLKWSARSLKLIYVQSENGRFDDYEEIRHVAKHEFGHVLGLGDLYESASDELAGVEKGSYPEIDGYHISDRVYNLVMCDHHGPISNNDVEMVVLAFSEDRMQLYQPSGKMRGVSDALGKGN